jgi:hypothetical protein
MFRFAQRQTRGLLVFLAVMAIALSACGGSSTTASPNAAPGSSGGSNPGATGNSGATNNNGGTGLNAAASAFANVNSYKFSMTLAGGTFSSMLSMLPALSASGNAPFTMSGTITVKPEKAADITIAGLHIIEIGGYDYIDMGGTGGFDQIPISGTRLADRFSPATMFSSAIDPSTAGGYNNVGTETKNGVQADHYQASSAALAELGSIAGITAATWTADVWIAQDGGYPVSMAIIGKADDNSIAYEVLFDITNVNDPANKVTAPTNVTGA